MRLHRKVVPNRVAILTEARSGLKKAIGTVSEGAAWQLGMHFMGNVLPPVPKESQDMVASIIRAAFIQPHVGT